MYTGGRKGLIYILSKYHSSTKIEQGCCQEKRSKDPLARKEAFAVTERNERSAIGEDQIRKISF